MTDRGVFQESISPEEIKLLCQNAQTLEMTRIRTPEQELNTPEYEDLMSEFYDPDSSAPWYVVVRAVEAFREKNGGRYPGVTQSQIETDFSALSGEVDAIMSRVNPDNDESIKVDDRYVREILRFSDSKIHSVSAFLGGVASEEAIKLLISQYTPLNHTMIYDGIHGRT